MIVHPLIKLCNFAIYTINETRRDKRDLPWGLYLVIKYVFIKLYNIFRFLFHVKLRINIVSYVYIDLYYTDLYTNNSVSKANIQLIFAYLR